jgi:nitrogen fixation/metabolism regulation signal transduction histidine kinase
MTIRRPHRPFWRTRTLRYTLIVVSAVACVLLFMLLSASSNTPLFEHIYPWILTANAVVAVAMLALVSWLVVRLSRRFRAGVFGARLMARFALAFALMGVVPGAVIYLVSVEFLSRSIESWFDVRVDNALESGLTLGRTVLDSMLSDVKSKARNMALALSDVQDTSLPNSLVRLRDQMGVEDAMLLTASGKVVASASGGSSLIAEMPPPAVFRQLRLTRSYSGVEAPLDSSVPGALRMRVIVAVPTADLSLFAADALYLQLVQRVPDAVAQNAGDVQNGMRDYQELSLSRASLRNMYTITLTLALLLAVFAALGVAFLLATWLTAPLLLLAEGTKAVAGGDYSPMQELSGKDELGTLMQSFNAMTRQLDEARGAVERNRLQLENAKAYLESILANLSAGVLVFDDDFRLVTANQGAERILGTSFASNLGERMSLLPDFLPLADAIGRAFGEQSGHAADWQKQIELQRPGDAKQPHGEPSVETRAADSVPLTLLARGSRCPVGEGEGYLVVFDDISDVISAQRSIAWGEVARRLAHEIKNPLTPIQLSAERLQMKLTGKIPDSLNEYLERSVATIVNQVTAMKRMVDDFRDYAKTPSASMAAVDLNSLVGEILGLYGVAAGRDSSGGIEMQLADDLPLIIGDATRLRQVIHNLVQNAQDATLERDDARVVIRTERIDAKSGAAGRDAMVRMTVADNGGGFPARILARAFEPYVTTKSRGTGLGLAVVKKIADEHDARIELRNGDAGGAVVSLLFTRVADRHLAVA